MKIIKIFLVGPSGSGKTTTLEFLDPNAKLLGEYHRKPTEEEIAAWGLDAKGLIQEEGETLVRTSAYPNFGQFIVSYDHEAEKFFINRETGVVLDNSYMITVVDGCGQQCFFPYREGGAAGAHGILFVIDSSRVETIIDKKTQELTYPYVNDILAALDELKTFYKEGNIYGPPSRKNPMLPPVVIMVNKQDIVEGRLKKTKMGRLAFWRALLRSHTPEFFGKYHFPFVESCALPIPEPYGIEKAISLLFYEIYKRLEQVSSVPKLR